MKWSLIAVSCLFSGVGMAQTQDLLVVANTRQQEVIANLRTELEVAKANGQANALLIEKLRKENETLREIMRGYVKHIDELNNSNLQLVKELEECEEEQSK